VSGSGTRAGAEARVAMEPAKKMRRPLFGGLGDAKAASLKSLAVSPVTGLSGSGLEREELIATHQSLPCFPTTSTTRKSGSAAPHLSSSVAASGTGASFFPIRRGDVVSPMSRLAYRTQDLTLQQQDSPSKGKRTVTFSSFDAVTNKQHGATCSDREWKRAQALVSDDDDVSGEEDCDHSPCWDNHRKQVNQADSSLAKRTLSFRPISMDDSQISQVPTHIHLLLTCVCVYIYIYGHVCYSFFLSSTSINVYVCAYRPRTYLTCRRSL
jgi:hypothetical protein